MREKERKNGWMKSCRFYIPSPGFGFEECFISETLQRGKKKREKDSVKILPAPMFRDDTIPTELETVTPKFENIMTHWVTELNKIQKHSGEAPLFTENLLSAGKDEQLSGQPLLRSPKPLKARTTSPEGQLFYRPERSHRYLQASMLESTAYELTEIARPRSVTLEPQLGRPTRSSLIRARQLALSAPGHRHLREKLKCEGFFFLLFKTHNCIVKNAYCFCSSTK
ncbi:uncharacterized protein LOC131697986 [Acipenser ruthenus]|uniref:uncharacterized protein LOC131697986 n=1 Tax=Acipenser ruthenus TaxID=7906 RepID=UPI002741A434|nr:uncharacterized protein LOC131697986 [Acipenser ruthenus]